MVNMMILMIMTMMTIMLAMMMMKMKVMSEVVRVASDPAILSYCSRHPTITTLFLIIIRIQYHHDIKISMIMMAANHFV